MTKEDNRRSGEESSQHIEDCFNTFVTFVKNLKVGIKILKLKDNDCEKCAPVDREFQKTPKPK